MKRAIKASKLHRMVAVEETVEIEKVVTATVVVLIALFPIAFVPDTLNVRKGCGFSLVHAVN